MNTDLYEGAKSRWKIKPSPHRPSDNDIMKCSKISSCISDLIFLLWYIYFLEHLKSCKPILLLSYKFHWSFHESLVLCFFFILNLIPTCFQNAFSFLKIYLSNHPNPIKSFLRHFFQSIFCLIVMRGFIFGTCVWNDLWRYLSVVNLIISVSCLFIFKWNILCF